MSCSDNSKNKIQMVMIIACLGESFGKVKSLTGISRKTSILVISKCKLFTKKQMFQSNACNRIHVYLFQILENELKIAQDVFYLIFFLIDLYATFNFERPVLAKQEQKLKIRLGMIYQRPRKCSSYSVNQKTRPRSRLFISDHYSSFIIELSKIEKEQMTSSYLSKPNTTKRTTSRATEAFAVTICEMQGWRSTMEDASVYKQLADDIYLFAVCDGHGGPEVSELVAKMLPDTLVKDSEFKSKQYGKALTNAFRKIDEYICSAKGEAHLRELNKELGGRPLGRSERIGYRAGTTVLALLMTKDTYYVANAGDSRAVLSCNNKAVVLSNDHKPDLPAQKSRIQKAGGYVSNGRVNNSLALSRSLGDFDFKHFSERAYQEQAVVSLPEIIEVSRRKQDKFILLGCDGIWQKYVNSNQKMVDQVQMFRNRYNGKTVMQHFLDDLLAKNAREPIGADNMSGILIELK